MDADLGGAGGDVEQTGDLVVRQVLETVQDEDLALVVGEVLQGVLHDREVVSAGGLFVGGGRVVVGEAGKISRIGGRGMARAAAVVIGGDAATEVVEPGAELSLVAVGVAVFEDALEDDLDEIFGRIRVAGETSQKAKEGAMMPFEQVAKPRKLTGSHGEHQIVVTGIVHEVRCRSGCAGRRGSEGN